MRISVIVPVHNSENTLIRCIESIIRQTYTDFELILVENGSHDKSLQICLNYMKQDERVRTFSIDACKGPSEPRNYGIEKSKGEGLIFVDSDDYIDLDMLNIINRELQENEAVFYGYSKESDTSVTNIIPSPINETQSIKNIALQLHKENCFGYVCCKAYRKNIIEEVRFDNELNLFEDELFTLQVLKKCVKISVYPYSLYHYVVCADSVSQQVHRDMVEKKDRIFMEWVHFLGAEYEDVLLEMAHAGIQFCKFYTYDHKTSIRLFYKLIRNTGMLSVALSSPSKYEEKIHNGFLNVYFDYYMYLVKCGLARLK